MNGKSFADKLCEWERQMTPPRYALRVSPLLDADEMMVVQLDGELPDGQPARMIAVGTEENAQRVREAAERLGVDVVDSKL